MARVVFTPNLQQHVACPPIEAEGGTVREVLEAPFRVNSQARSYVLDDQGALRRHMMVFVNGNGIRDRAGLADPVPPGGEVYVMQARREGKAHGLPPLRRDPETAWFVPARKDEYRHPVDGKVVVGRTRDGGKMFETLCQGLPQEHAYDLTFRHGLDLDAGGRRLAFGSTTGSLWVSEDQGESWATVSEHLPPIYCVRFA